MISLKEYKESLINKYVYEYDNNDTMREKRKLWLEKKYSDDALESIIRDTYSFIKDVMDSDTIKDGYCEFEIDDDNTKQIDLLLVGGYPSDTLFVDNKNRVISKRIINKELGNYLDIQVRLEEIEFDDVDEEYDVRGTLPRYYLYLNGIPKDIEEIRQRLFGDSVVPFELYKELYEGTKGVVSSKDKEEVLNGLSDIYNTIKDIAIHYGYSYEDIEKCAKEKYKLLQKK